MSKQRPTPTEVASRSIENELVQIKERLSAIESLEGLTHQDVVAAHLEQVIKGSARRAEILRHCHDGPTKNELIGRCGFNNAPALDGHLKPLREDGLMLHTRQDDDGILHFIWSYMLQHLPVQRRRKILGG